MRAVELARASAWVSAPLAAMVASAASAALVAAAADSAPPRTEHPEPSARAVRAAARKPGSAAPAVVPSALQTEGAEGTEAGAVAAGSPSMSAGPAAASAAGQPPGFAGGGGGGGGQA